VKTETAKPSEEKRREENKTCAVSFTQNAGLNLNKCSSLPVVLRSSLLSYYGVCNHKKAGRGSCCRGSERLPSPQLLRCASTTAAHDNRCTPRETACCLSLRRRPDAVEDSTGTRIFGRRGHPVPFPVI
jgi:hypothetical protein